MNLLPKFPLKAISSESSLLIAVFLEIFCYNPLNFQKIIVDLTKYFLSSCAYRKICAFHLDSFSKCGI